MLTRLRRRRGLMTRARHAGAPDQVTNYQPLERSLHSQGREFAGTRGTKSDGIRENLSPDGVDQRYRGAISPQRMARERPSARIRRSADAAPAFERRHCCIIGSRQLFIRLAEQDPARNTASASGVGRPERSARLRPGNSTSGARLAFRGAHQDADRRLARSRMDRQHRYGSETRSQRLHHVTQPIRAPDQAQRAARTQQPCCALDPRRQVWPQPPHGPAGGN